MHPKFEVLLSQSSQCRTLRGMVDHCKLRTELLAVSLAFCALASPATVAGDDRASESPGPDGTAFFEKKIRPLLVEHCYECHSEDAREQQGGLLLDRPAAWLKGGQSGKAVVPGEPDSSLLMQAVRYRNEDLQMPPEEPLDADSVRLLEEWIRRGAPGPRESIGETSFSRLGDQDYLFGVARDHWAFQPVEQPPVPESSFAEWEVNEIDRFVAARLAENHLHPSDEADARSLLRRLSYAVTGLPPSMEDVRAFVELAPDDRRTAYAAIVDDLLDSPAFGEHVGRMWLDVARYADTDSFYRPDTRTPHYFPFAFTYRDYVIDSMNADKPFDQFVCEQLAADLMGIAPDAPEIAALGFMTVGPHANRNPTEAIDDWIDATTRGLMGMTVACARCHDHKFEPIPTADYYSLAGVFASVVRVHPLDEDKQPQLAHYMPDAKSIADYKAKRAEIEKKINGAGNSKAKNNNRSIAKKIRETELAQLLSFHDGAPVHAMIVKERPKPFEPFILNRGDPTNRGPRVPRRFLKILDPAQTAFPQTNSGRLELAKQIVSPDNPLTARVFVNRVWGLLNGAPLVQTTSDFGLQSEPPTHPLLLDWLAADFMENGWSIKHLVRSIVTSATFRQSTDDRVAAATLDPENRLLWRARRRHLSIEEIRDSMLVASHQLDPRMHGRPADLWEKDDYTHRRSIYGYINRFNLDPTLRVFSFPTPMQTQPMRDESIVAPQALFTMNAPFVVDQADAMTRHDRFLEADKGAQRATILFELAFQREPSKDELSRIIEFVDAHTAGVTSRPDSASAVSAWSLAAQALLMSNEFQYVD